MQGDFRDSALRPTCSTRRAEMGSARVVPDMHQERGLQV